jgi:hypothetical protein
MGQKRPGAVVIARRLAVGGQYQASAYDGRRGECEKAIHGPSPFSGAVLWFQLLMRVLRPKRVKRNLSEVFAPVERGIRMGR